MLLKGAAMLAMASHISGQTPAPKTMGVVLFTGFELIDAMGPLEYFNSISFQGTNLKIVTISETGEPVGTYVANHPTMRPDGTWGNMNMEALGFQGQTIYANYSYANTPKLDYLLLPGGMGSRIEINNNATLQFLREKAEEVEYFLTVCTGSTIAAKAGVLNGKKATSNKAAWGYVTSDSVSPKGAVDWIARARWVHDGKFITSSGVQAGMDMAHYWVGVVYGTALADRVAVQMEYEPHRDAAWDPFSELYGLSNATTTTPVPTPTPVTVTVTQAPVTVTATVTKPVTVTVSATTTTQPPRPTAALYGQCGGQGWNGPTACPQVSCKVVNKFFSQCSP
ncbi:hypothetical protein HK097_008063 [Rhizophlyctis rosea]|uniref:CBM1 domain-containing protein n=1 Tax=Rhizophlyctis rosea TaxID=64517 RepID=A0AAD5X4T0_9FUNG|nr:hypothetical protein HK097_008063 [Rhizophlyctis rosea]